MEPFVDGLEKDFFSLACCLFVNERSKVVNYQYDDDGDQYYLSSISTNMLFVLIVKAATDVVVWQHLKQNSNDSIFISNIYSMTTSFISTITSITTVLVLVLVIKRTFIVVRLIEVNNFTTISYVLI